MAYRIPVYSVRLVRDRSQASEFKRVRQASDVFSMLGELLEEYDREVFGVLLLDTQNTIKGIHIATMGTLDASLVHPREVFKPAILASSASIILFHNHPSGDPTPSQEDRAVTRQLVAAGNVLGITVMDHVIVGEGRYVSFAETGLMGTQS